jgi:RHS repeat-associated protein
MLVRAAPSFTSSPNAISTTCRIVVAYDRSSTRYFLPDHLNSTNVVTDASGSPIQVLDYYPYGSTRISQTTGSFNEQKQYVGQYEDPETNLSYLQARYYSNANGQFLSEDPSHLAIGNPQQLKQLTGQDQQTYLADPQQLNSYGYGRDNPINNEDPKGLDSYYNNAGQLVFSDNRTNGSFYQANDAAMLAGNVQAVTTGNAASNFAYWIGAVQPGGAWDYKGPAARGGRGYYFFNGQLLDANAFGNATYGYTGAAMGLGSNVLTDAAGAVEAYDVGKTNKGITLTNISGNFNAPENTANIRLGINTFNSGQFSNTLSRTSQAVSNAGYNAASAPILARLVTLLTAAAQTLRSLGAK